MTPPDSGRDGALPAHVTAQMSALQALLEPALTALGLDLEDLDLSRAGKRSVLRVAVDRDDGVSMDDVADATREISRLLDESDVMGAQAYTLEVGSPGVDRPLTLPRHWRRNVDRMVTVTLVAATPPDDGSLTGRITAADDDRVVLEVDGEPREVAYADVRRAKVQIEFKRPGPTSKEA